jgi:hypothetical protein
MSLDPSRPATREATLTARPAAGPPLPDPWPDGAPAGFHLLAGRFADEVMSFLDGG